MSDIPQHFPRRIIMSSLSGAMPKLSVRRDADSTYTNLVSDEAHLAAYENAEHLAQSLKTYVLRKEVEHPEWGRADVLRRVKNSMAEKHRSGQWDVEPSEQAWIMQRLVQLLE